MPQKLVDKIPLVLYIPSPEEEAVTTPQLEEKAKELAGTEIVEEDVAGEEAREDENEQKAEVEVKQEVLEEDITERDHTTLLRDDEPKPEPESGSTQAPMTYPPLPTIIVHPSDESAPDSKPPTRPPRPSSPPLPLHSPSPVPSTFSTTASTSATPVPSPSQSPVPLPILSPVPSASTLRRPNPRFAFFRRSKSRTSSLAPSTTSPSEIAGITTGAEEEEEAAEGEGGEGEPVNWEDRWEKAAWPFVRLEGNRAVCAICLMDFDEPPRRKPGSSSSKGKAKQSQKPKPNNSAAGKWDLKKDAGDGGEGKSGKENPSASGAVEPGEAEPEPLRLLECGHVFHVCIFMSYFPLGIC